MLIDHLAALGQTSTLAQLEAELDKALRSFGAETWTYYLLLPPWSDDRRYCHLSTYPTDWVIHYQSNSLVDRDPVIRGSLQAIKPFQWSTLPLRGSAEAAVLEQARSYGLRDGLAVPVPSRGEIASLSIAFDAKPPEVSRWARAYEAYATMVGTYAHDVARLHFLYPNGRQRLLTLKESEIVKWLAQGKTSWETGVILNTTEGTVNHHIRNAIQKLDVANRVQLVARSLSLGLISTL